MTSTRLAWPRLSSLRKSHPLAAYCLDGLGEIELERGRLDQSEEHFHESLTIRQAGLGEGHREVAYCLDGLGRVAAARHHDEQAQSLLDEASAILRRELGSSAPRHNRDCQSPSVPETTARS